ncbi:transporter substrate-binding domain-containing protein [Streptomyces sp. NPDC001787]|uniref:transporter substrate-binding domain-containing protein n=1 Tax=Streptomyces sp. NPDC001787 TaxID=3154523 RepID=UPI003316BFE0
MHDEDRPTHRLSGNLHGTYEAKALAQWLRELVGDRSTHMLHDAFPYSPGESQWSDILSGRKLISITQLTGLVNYLVPDQTLRRAYLHDGAQLMEAAERAEAARRAARSKSRTAPGNTVPTVRRRVVPAPPTDGADNNSETAEEEPLAVPEGNKPQDHGAAPSAGGTGTSPAAVQPGGHGRGPRIALIGTACLALLTGGGWLTWNHLHEARQTAGAPGVAPTSPSPSASPSPEDTAFAALEKAKRGKKGKGNFKFVVGVKRSQKKLSEKVGGEWVGAEIDYAVKVLEAMGLAEDWQYEFKGVATDDREKELAEGGGGGEEMGGKGVDMFIGTYGISDGRKKGSAKKPAVIFAGPYLETDQRIMMRKNPNKPEEALFDDDSRVVNDLTDLPDGARVCVVSGSTAELHVNELSEEKGELPYEIIPRSDYNICVADLDKGKDPESRSGVDAVMTDAAILRGFQVDRNWKYIISADDFGKSEEYGIDLSKNSLALKSAVCKAMEEVREYRSTAYSTLGKSVTISPKMWACADA